MMAGVDKSKEEEKKAAKEEKKAAGVWNPTFRPEDFMEDADQSKAPNATPAVAGPSSKTEDARSGKEEDKGDGLDLNLSFLDDDYMITLDDETPMG
ncbi:hypothetical protein F0562_029187 [Nyssa sinensis]|uniref:Uncharacterized protein n=1 Tax=Nyssa sinensis TaxID=561372 RepID=A0A5J5B1X5_9ASTE|nr:hypothetical protein F0562_029187 [Nyssa sinensis]